MRRLALLLVLAVAASSCSERADIVTDASAAADAAPTGRAALAAAQGEPHVLWFWGAH